MKLRLLVVEDDVALGHSLLEVLGQHSFASTLARSRLRGRGFGLAKPL